MIDWIKEHPRKVAALLGLLSCAIVWPGQVIGWNQPNPSWLLGATLAAHLLTLVCVAGIYVAEWIRQS